MGATIEAKPEQFIDFMKTEIDGPIVMINLLKFDPNGGVESYKKYGELAAPHLMKANGKILYHGSGRATVIGEDSWDTVILVEYPNKQAFIDMVTSPEYIELSKNRTDGLLDSRLFCTQKDAAPVL